MNDASSRLGGGGPSRTAVVTARARAYHQIADRPLILDDPLAVAVTGCDPKELADPVPGPPDGPDREVRPRRLFFAARSRFAEDTVAAAYADGVRQVVVLGAGLDTFAYRNPHADLRVFEVDHPASQEWKRDRLAEAGIVVPSNASLVPVDFEKDDLGHRLAAAGFLRTDPAVFVWLGVVFYLTEDAVGSTLGYLAGQGRPTEVVFDYLTPPTTPEGRERFRERADRLAAAGEPWFSFFTPPALETRLRALGFTEVEDLSAAELIDGYLGTSEFAVDAPASVGPSRILRARR
ncbi:MAG: class I SAM-dependent methyltransferase [Gordonia sp. (in: high G+C Gram-positive bacteria)]|uniref:class I SAM-dependent methyltransferase n=1 Tax=Gordonia sp. (in: high G+C Gram-positive bacteria) TaxID=84139 RepID=UPI0039E35CFF